jgi:SAM-dependent methyltransferase
MIISELTKYGKKPEIFKEGTSNFWEDEYISKGLLQAHLEPEWEAASRKHNFINESVKWIYEIASPVRFPKLLDLGCGPGLYAERFCNQGYEVTGIDFSIRSINYAKEKAKVGNKNIKYHNKNYLEIDYNNEFELITLIYCDLGVFSDLQRDTLLQKVYSALKDGGKFIFDVFTPNNYEVKVESNTWGINDGSGLWKPDTHISLDSHYIYDNNVRLNQSIVIDKEDKVDVFRIWDHSYTRDSIIDVVSKIGFKKMEVYSDVAGTTYRAESKTICLVLEK